MSRKKKFLTKKVRNTGEELALRKIGKICIELRNQKGLSIDQLSKMGERLSTSAISRIESGSPVNTSTLIKYARTLGVPAKVFFDFDLDSKDFPVTQPVFISEQHKSVEKEAYKTILPFFALKAAAGNLSAPQFVETPPASWIQVKNRKLSTDQFVVQAVGKSMEPLIPDQGYVVFKKVSGSPEQGAIVLIQYRGIYDPDTGGSFAIKRFKRVKLIEGTHGVRPQVTLEPLNPKFEPIVLDITDELSFTVIGEFQFLVGT